MKIFVILSLVYTFKLQDTIGLLSSMTGLQNGSTDMLANQLTKLILKNTDYKYPIETVKFPKVRTQRIELVTIDNVVINAYLLAPKVMNKDTTAAIMLHGIGTNRENFIIDHKLYNMVNKHNIVLLVPDYRDFGDSEGTFTIEGCTYDVDACCKFMRLILGLEQVNIIGFSFGTGTALEYIKRSSNNKKWVIAANKPDVKLHRIDGVMSKKSIYRFVAVDSDCNFYVRVVLLGSFSNFVNVMERDLNIFEVVAQKFSFILDYLKEFLPYDNEDAIKTIHRKNVLLLHGKNDTTLCDWHCKKLAAVSGADYVLYNETHDGLVDKNEVWTKILCFFRRRK